MTEYPSERLEQAMVLVATRGGMAEEVAMRRKWREKPPGAAAVKHMLATGRGPHLEREQFDVCVHQLGKVAWRAQWRVRGERNDKSAVASRDLFVNTFLKEESKALYQAAACRMDVRSSYAAGGHCGRSVPHLEGGW